LNSKGKKNSGKEQKNTKKTKKLATLDFSLHLGFPKPRAPQTFV
jgi:hypothetical protein